MQKLLEKLDSTYRKSVRHRKREAEKLNSTEIESDYKVRIIPQSPFPILTFHPESSPIQILQLLKPKDEIVIKSNRHTDKFVLVHISKPNFNPHVYQFDIGVDCANGNKKKIAHPDNNLFYAEINNIRTENTPKSGGKNSYFSNSRPISAVITRVYERNDIPAEIRSDDKNEYDVRLRKDEFGFLANPGTK